MNKKAVVGLISVIIGIAIVALLIANFAIPMVKQSTDGIRYSENLIKVNATNNETFNLTQKPVLAASFSITGLTTANYSIDYTLARVVLNDKTANNTYSANYQYTTGSYLTNTSERVLFAVIGLALIIGLIAYMFNEFGLG